MNKTAAISLTASAAALILAPVFGVSAAETAAEPAAAAVQAVAPAPVVQKLTEIDAVAKARELLGQELAKRDAAAKKGRTYASKTSPLDVVIAVWDRSDDSIRLYEGTKRGPKLKLPAGAPAVSVSLDAGLSSRYDADDPDSAVVGVIYPVLTKTKVNKKTVYAADEVVYTPFSKDLYKPGVLAAGSDYLSRRVGEAYDELRAKGIRSRAFPDKLLVDVMDPYLIKSVLIIEHTSEAGLFKQDDPESTLGYFLAVLALNRDDAFSLDVSTAGAQGLAQFIPSTYRLMVRNRKDLGLITDFTAGMSDHKNSIIAEVAYLDESLADMPDGLKKLYLSDSAQAAEFLAAAYNGGSTRVKKAYALWGDDWAASHQPEINKLSARNEALIDQIEGWKAKLKKTADKKAAKTLNDQIWSGRVERKKVLAQLSAMKVASLKAETVGYVGKLKKVYGMLVAGVFATPAAPANTLIAQLPAPQATRALADAGAPAQTICFSDGGCVTGR